VARKVVILGFPGVQALDLVGPFDVFTGASLLVNGAYEVALASVDGQPVATGTGLEFVATKLPDPREPIDTLLLPGGVGVDGARANADVMTWLHTAAQAARRVVSVCTGAFLAAEAGLLDGCRATTHWAFARQLQDEFPAVDVDPEPIFLRSSEKSGPPRAWPQASTWHCRSSKTTTAPMSRRPWPVGWCCISEGPAAKRNSPLRCGCRAPIVARSATCRRPSKRSQAPSTTSPNWPARRP
jgi:putative intracellular protease/amidase